MEFEILFLIPSLLTTATSCTRWLRLFGFFVLLNYGLGIVCRRFLFINGICSGTGSVLDLKGSLSSGFNELSK